MNINGQRGKALIALQKLFAVGMCDRLFYWTQLQFNLQPKLSTVPVDQMISPSDYSSLSFKAVLHCETLLWDKTAQHGRFARDNVYLHCHKLLAGKRPSVTQRSCQSGLVMSSRTCFTSHSNMEMHKDKLEQKWSLNMILKAKLNISETTVFWRKCIIYSEWFSVS